MYTRDSLIAAVESFDPVAATKIGLHATHLFSTEVIEEVLDSDGTIITLNYQPGKKYAACYVRVSTEQQKKDGFNLSDQIKRAWDYCVRERLAFRVFSDATMSGGDPIKDDELIKMSLKKEADYYEEAFKAVFIQSAEELGDPDIIASTNAYLEKALNDIRAGRLQNTEQFEEKRKGKGRAQGRDNLTFRPALTVLVHELRFIHSIVMTDWSRASRNHSLSLALLEVIGKNRKIVGTVESLEMLTGQSMADEFMQFVLSYMAAYYLRQLKLNILRAKHQMLSEGLPDGNLPPWFEEKRDGQGRAVLKPVEADNMRIMIRMAIETGDGGYKLAARLNEMGIPSPTGHSEWTRPFIQDKLKSVTLLGYQDQFGRKWKTLPALIDEDDWFKVQSLIQKRSIEHGNGRNTQKTGGYMMTGLLRCWCGAPLVRHPHRDSHLIHYVCGSHPTVKQRLRAEHGDRRHIQVLTEDTDRFWNTWFEVYSLTEMPNLSQRGTREVQQLQTMLTEMRVQLERDRHQVVKESRQLAAQMGYGEVVVAAMVAEKLKGREDEINELEISLRHKQMRIVPRAFTSEVERKDGSHTVFEGSKWMGALDHQKNAILKTIIDKIQFHEDQNATYVVVSLNDEENNAMPPIYLNAKYDKQKTVRRWPITMQWIDDMQAFSLARQS